MSVDFETDTFDQLVRGVCPVLEIPFRPDATVDDSGFSAVVEHVLGTGVSAIFWPGFASEFHKISDVERLRLRTLLLEQTLHRSDVSVIVGVAQHATHLAIEDAVSAVDAGASVINLLPPHFLNPSKSSVLGHIRSVLSAVDPVPVIVQHAPSLAPSRLAATDLCALANDHSNLRMIKVESVPPGSFIAALKAGRPALPAMVGFAGVMMIDALRRGAVGVQPGCSSVEIYLAIWQLWDDGRTDEAEALHRRLLPFISYWMQEVELIIQVEKTISKERGLIDHDHCRAPGRELDAEERLMIRRFLTEFEDFLG